MLIKIATPNTLGFNYRIISEPDIYAYIVRIKTSMTNQQASGLIILKRASVLERVLKNLNYTKAS